MNDDSDNEGPISRSGHALRPKMSAKILLYFVGIALVPLIAVSFVLVSVANQQLLQNASDKQKAVAVDLSKRVDNYLANNINLLSYTGRLYATHNLTTSQVDKNITTLFDENTNLKQVTMVTTNDGDGVQRTLAKVDGKVAVSQEAIDTSPDILNFISGKSFFITVGRDTSNKPQIGIGIPILKNYPATASTNPFEGQGTDADNMFGAIIGYYDISDLWKSVLSAKIGTGGYAYVVDGVGSLVAHPDKTFINSHREVKEVEAVRQFLGNNFETKQTISETSQDVISTPYKTLSGWAVIVEEPVSSIYAGINSYVQLAFTIGIAAIILCILLGILFSRQITRPIKELALGAKLIELGEFDQPINVNTGDELQELANTFNGMAKGIKRLIGDLKTNNLKLTVEQAKLNNIISSVSDGIMAVNSKGEIVSINPPAAMLIGHKPSALEGTKMNDKFHWMRDEARFTPDLSKPGVYHHTDLTLTRDESIVYLDLMVSVLEQEHSDSDDVAAIITIHDQTQSRELSFMKLDFVAIAAHELRTPLTVVRGYLDMLSTSVAKELSVYNLENLQKAIVGADQLRQLINKLLNIARIERGDMEIFIEKLNLTKLVKENVEQHQTTAAQRQQTLTYKANTESTVYAPADTASIVEVLNNLIGNAIKYTEKGGKVEVNLLVSSDHKEVKVQIVDNGPGVPEELRDRLFTKFYRAERSLIAGTRGTGLGLFISKTIIELQNGTIGIEPDEGKGSTFYFTLPIYNAERDDEQIAKKTSGGIRGWFKKRPTS